jgi:hypothetical protein
MFLFDYGSSSVPEIRHKPPLKSFPFHPEQAPQDKRKSFVNVLLQPTFHILFSLSIRSKTQSTKHMQAEK